MKKHWFPVFILIVAVVIFIVILSVASSGECAVQKSSAAVRGDSLHGELENGEQVLVEYGYYKCNRPQRGDLVAYRFPGKTAPLVKIVRAIPGDVFNLAPNGDNQFELFINGQTLRVSSGRPYLFDEKRARLLQLYARDYQGVIPPEAYLILGNEPAGSLDSSAFGLVGGGELIGRVIPGRQLQ